MLTVLAMAGVAYLVAGAVVGTWTARRTPRDAPLDPLVMFVGTTLAWPWVARMLRAELRRAREADETRQETAA